MGKRELGLGLLALLLAACVSAKESPQAGGESHFLRRCDDKCGAGLDCIQGLCTRGCVVDKDACGDLATGAVCTAESVEPGEVAVCDVACSATKDCAAISASHRCEAGFCRAPLAVSVGPGAGDTSFRTDRVFPCPENAVSDPVEVLDELILGDELQLRISYGGTCMTHAFGVCFHGGFRESYPVQITLRVVHEDHGDPCNSVGTRELSVDLTPLGDFYDRNYDSDAGLIRTNFGLYAFGPLSCEERTDGAQGQLLDYEKQADRACTSADDCQLVRRDTRCTRGCGTVVSKRGAAELTRWLSVMDDQVCGDYQGDRCPLLPGVQCPAVTVACVVGQCQEQSP